MRTKSLVAPTGVEKGHEWLSPVGHAESWHRFWNGTAWQDVETEEVEETESTEETNGEQRNEAEVSDRDGQQEPDAGAKQPADGKQGKGRGRSRGK